MADFFEQLGKKISDVAEDFGKKPDPFSGSCQ